VDQEHDGVPVLQVTPLAVGHAVTVEDHLVIGRAPHDPKLPGSNFAAAIPYSPLTGSMTVETVLITLAGKPPHSACSRTAASSSATYTQYTLSVVT
jgi:hypothetical protein